MDRKEAFKRALRDHCSKEMEALVECRKDFPQLVHLLQSKELENNPSFKEYSTQCGPYALKLANCAANHFCKKIRQEVSKISISIKYGIKSNVLYSR